MFTGIITDLGQVEAVVPASEGDSWFRISTSYDLSEVEIGASIACSGCCLTVVEKGENSFAVDVSGETLSKTNLGDWEVGRRINLERSLKVGDELGGHLVYGHVDGVAEIVGSEPEGGSTRWRFRAPVELARFIAPKGSVALDGVSLTVNEVEGREFGVNIIPHTTAVTSFGSYQVGDRVNLEIDVLARYVARLREEESSPL